jgi:Fe-S cluster assembly protein SufB
MSTDLDILKDVSTEEYKYGFTTDIEMEIAPVGLNEDIVRFISQKKNEPEWMLEYRLKSLRHFLKLQMPTWQNFELPAIDFQSISYYAAPKKQTKLNSLDEVDPELLATFEKLGIPLSEQKLLSGVAVDAVFDSVSVATTFKDKWE